jgi:hypothetical protein
MRCIKSFPIKQLTFGNTLKLLACVELLHTFRFRLNENGFLRGQINQYDRNADNAPL